jgi:hypothetical protein
MLHPQNVAGRFRQGTALSVSDHVALLQTLEHVRRKWLSVSPPDVLQSYDLEPFYPVQMIPFEPERL